MLFRVLADLILIVHFGFVVFVVFGGLLALSWPRVVWGHLPAAAWGVLVECTGWPCPLTPLEHWLRTRGGTEAADTGFLEYYVLPLLYPAWLTVPVQWTLAAVVLVMNGLIYGWVFHRRRPLTPG